MYKLISKDALLDELSRMIKDSIWQLEISDAISAIVCAPEIEDVTPVVHSRWILDSSDEYADHYHCGKCGAEIDLCNEIYTEPIPNYCHNCGAKMDGGATR